MSARHLAILSALFLVSACTKNESRSTTPESEARAERAAHVARAEPRPERDERRDDERREEATANAENGPAVATPSALDQSNDEDDLAVTQRIRQAVVADERLSFLSKNVVIVTQLGVVTLRGDVSTADEHAVIVTIAQRADGVVRVDDQLAIATP